VAATLALFAFTAGFAFYYRAARLSQARNWLREAERLEQQGQLAASIERYRNALAVTHDAANRLALGRALVKAGRFEEAEIYLSEVLRADPSNGPACAAMAQIYEARGRNAEAASWYRRAAYSSWPPDAEGLRREMRFRVADMLARDGQTELAATELLSLVHEVSSDPAIPKRAAATLLEMQRPQEAAEAYRSILRKDRSDAEAWLGYGRAQMALLRLEEAREAAHTALRLNPGWDAAQELIKLLESALALDPTARGLSLSQRYGRSRRLLEEALAAAQSCSAARSDAAASLGERIAAGRRELLRGARASEEVIRSIVTLAEQLWSEGKKVCGTNGKQNAALELALQRAAQAFTASGGP
jgi:tetratricopeptide (TPR) repeat protein